MKFVIFDSDIPKLFMKGKPFGGVALRKYLFARGLSEVGENVSIIVFKGEANLLNYHIENVIESYNPYKGIKYIRWIYYRIPIIIKALMKSKGDVFIIVSGGGIINFVISLYSFFTFSKLILLVKSDKDVSKDLDHLSYKDKIINKYLLKMSHKIICQNNKQLNDLSIYYSRMGKIIKNPFLNKEYNKIINSQREYIAFLGSFRPVKNIKAILELAKNNINIRFKVAGDFTGEINDDNERIIKALKKLENVTMVGFIPHQDVGRFLSKAICLLNTSFYEGFSNTFLEAFNVGTPIVTLGVNPDQILTKQKLGFVTTLEEFPILYNKYLSNLDYELYSKRSINYLYMNHSYKEKAKELIKIVKN